MTRFKDWKSKGERKKFQSRETFVNVSESEEESEGEGSVLEIFCDVASLDFLFPLIQRRYNYSDICRCDMEMTPTRSACAAGYDNV